MLNTFGAWASILAFLLAVVPFANWLRRRLAQGGIRVETVPEPGLSPPQVSRELGFTPPVVKITVVNEGEQTIKVNDIRLMFSGEYGYAVVTKAPLGHDHPELPSGLDPGTMAHWYIDAERLSELLSSTHRPSSTTVSKARKVKLYARCITGTGKIYKSRSFPFSVDPNAHWPFSF